MTPKQKAQQLVSKYYDLICNLIEVKNGKEQGERYKIIMPISKKCALIAIDEILNDDWFILNLEDLIARKEYWEEVKQEIINL